jgi:predicted DNA-binding transcriptional regulator AlpA
MTDRTRRPTQPELAALKLIPRHEARELIGVSRPTFNTMEKRGELPPAVFVTPTKRAYRLADIEAWIVARTAEPGKKLEPVPDAVLV